MSKPKRENNERVIDDPSVTENFVDGVCSIYFEGANAVLMFSRRRSVEPTSKKVENIVRARLVMPIVELKSLADHAQLALTDHLGAKTPKQVN